jgi:pimeloyl-ACP methyl ester carboxylesterase
MVPGLELISRIPPSGTRRPPVLLIHGARHSAWYWRRWLDMFCEAGWPSFALSLRGHGASEGSIRWASLRDYVDDVLWGIRSFAEPPVLIGHSLGGLLVEHAVHLAPVRAAVLVAPAPSSTGFRTALTFARGHLGSLPGVLIGRPIKFKPHDLFSAEVDPQEAERIVASLGPESARAQYEGLLPRRAPAAAGCPLQIVASPDDAMVPAAATRRIAARQGVEPIWFPGFGHDMMLEPRTAEVVRAVTTWLEGLVMAGRPCASASTASAHRFPGSPDTPPPG